MKLGMPILLEYNTIEDNLKLAKKLGFDFVELNLNFGYCREEMEEGIVKDLLDKYGLEATLHFFDEADMGSYDEVVEAYISLLKKYAILGNDYIKKINIHNERGPVVTISGKKNFIYEKEYEKYLPKLIKNYQRIKDILSDLDIELVIENIDGINGANFIYDNFINLSKNGFCFTLDVGHDYLENYRFFDLIVNNELNVTEMHLHDGLDKRCHLALGEGIIDIKTFKNYGIDNDLYVVLEVKSSSDMIKSVDIFNKL